MAQTSPVLRYSNRLVIQSSGLHGSSCVVTPLAEAENLPRRRQTCCEHLLGSLPLFLSQLPSLHPSLTAPLLNLSLPFLSSASIFPSFLLRSASLLHFSIPASIPALPNHRRDSSRAQQTLPQVLVYLTYSNVPSLYYTGCGKNDTAGLACIARRHYVYTLCFHWKQTSPPCLKSQQALTPKQQNTFQKGPSHCLKKKM